MIRSEQVDSLLTFLEPVNSYDREEYFSEKFSSVDPGSPKEISAVLESEYFLDPWYSTTNAEVKQELAKSLVAALSDSGFDFRWLVEDADGTFQLPSGWEACNPRELYEQIYALLFKHWRAQCEAGGLVLPDPESLRVPVSTAGT